MPRSVPPMNIEVKKYLRNLKLIKNRLLSRIEHIVYSLKIHDSLKIDLSQ